MKTLLTTILVVSVCNLFGQELEIINDLGEYPVTTLEEYKQLHKWHGQGVLEAKGYEILREQRFIPTEGYNKVIYRFLPVAEKETNRLAGIIVLSEIKGIFGSEKKSFTVPIAFKGAIWEMFQKDFPVSNNYDLHRSLTTAMLFFMVKYLIIDK